MGVENCIMNNLMRSVLEGTIRVIKSRRKKWAAHLANIE